MCSNNQGMAALATINNVGATGAKAITGTNAVTPAAGYYFFKLVAMAATVVAAQGNVTDAINATLSAFTAIPVTGEVYGKFNSITLTSGQMIGYYAKL